MGSRSLGYVGILLAALALGCWWLAARPISAPERHDLEVGASSVDRDVPAPPAVEFPLEAPQPQSRDEETTRHTSTADPVEVIPQVVKQDFRVKYGERTIVELGADKASLSVRIRLLESVRFEELFAQFPDLLAQGKFGARVIPEGASFTTPAGYAAECRTMKNAAGMDERRYLEFGPHLEPTIADSKTEREWLYAWIEAKAEMEWLCAWIAAKSE